MAVAGSLRGVAGRYAASGWAVVQFDLDEHGAMHGTIRYSMRYQEQSKELRCGHQRSL